jgi:hypothetical protein
MNPAWRTWPLKLRPGGPGGADIGRWVTPEELNVAPGLLGRPLARPWRRLLAMGVDLAAIGIVSSLSNFWLLAACSLGVWERARAKKRGPSPWRTLTLWLLVALMAYAGLQLVIEEFSGSPRERAAATDDDENEVDDAYIDGLLVVPPSSASAPQAAASVAEAAPAVSAAASIAALQAQVRRLQRQLDREHDAAAEAAAAEHWRERLRRFGLDFGVSYGWSLVYFTMLPVWWRGQTLGKRLFGLRIIEITGKPMTPLLSFKRFGGYIAGLGTGGLGLVQLLWDPNRQALQDKAAHTVVIDERLPRRPVPPDVVAPAPAEPSAPLDAPTSSTA